MWRFAVARAPGTSHLKSSLPCQDRVGCTLLPNGTLVAALADGAGSAVMAEQGAEIAVDTAIAYLKRSLEDGRSDYAVLLRETAATAREAIVAEAGRHGLEPKSYASTFLAIVLGPEGGGVLQIGDGVIVVNDGGEGWSWVFWPQRGEYANTTFFLTDQDALERVDLDVLPVTITDVALMSDGLEPLALKYASKEVHDPYFDGMFQPLHKADGSAEIPQLSESLTQFLASDRVGSRTDDDVSLILATRRNRNPS